MSNRKALLAKTSIAVKELRIGEDDFRAMLEHRYGVTSRTKMTDRQLTDLVEHFKASGWKPKPARKPAVYRKNQPDAPNAPLVAKIRALWISGWHLGVVRESSDDALSAFGRNITGTERLEWQHGENASKVIEGVKDMLAREGGVKWPSDWRDVRAARRAVIRAQMRRLHAAGVSTAHVIDLVIDAGRLNELSPGLVDIDAAFERLDPKALDRIIAVLGEQVRAALAAGRK